MVLMRHLNDFEQLCNVEEEKSQLSGENIYPPKIPQLSTSKLITNDNNIVFLDKKEKGDLDNQDNLSSSSLSSEYKYNCPERDRVNGTKLLPKLVQNEYNYNGFDNKPRHLAATLLVPTELERLSVVRQCLNSVTDLSTDELSMTGNASGNITGEKDFLNLPQKPEAPVHENQHGVTEAPTSDLLETEKSLAASVPSNANTPRKANDGDISLASISLGSANNPLPSSPSLSTTFTLSG